MIKPNASPDEFSSPFFKANEKFCKEVEQYVSENNGETKGKYNAWSYSIFGKVNNTKPWTLKYKKSTYTGTGNIFLSAEYESLLTLLEWKTKRIENSNNDFIIRKKTKFDFLKKLLNSKIENLNGTKNYIIKRTQSKPLFIEKMIEILNEPFNQKEIYQIELKNGVLRIEMRTKNQYFEILNKLFEMNI